MPKPLRLAGYLTTKELLERLPISRPTFFRWIKLGRFGDLIKKDQIGDFYYAKPQDLPKILAIIQK